MRSPLPVVVRSVRHGLRRSAQRSPGARRLLERTRAEADRALRDDRYDAGYFGGHGGSFTGYERYDRKASHADQAAFVVWRHLEPRSVLDIGCALGYVVAALREVGVDATGADVNQWAIDQADDAVRPHLRWADLTRKLPFPDGAFDVVTALETLEHLEPAQVRGVLAELARVTRTGVIATIPSFGPNGGGGPDGFLVDKVRAVRLSHYEALGPGYAGPVPRADLFLDARGEPIHGHLTIASFSWWTEQFAAAGFVRRPVLEGEMQNDLERLGLAGAWNLYALEKAGRGFELAQRSRTEVAALVDRWELPAGDALVAATRDGPPPRDARTAPA